jgi:glucan phosphoethanolaminetransferase (alkaline phosphatase superfamily)
MLFVLLLYAIINPAAPLSAGPQLLVFLVMLFFILLLHYLLATTSFIYIRTSDLGQSIKKLFTVIIRNIHLALLPILLMLITFVVLNAVMALLMLTGPLISTIIITLLLLGFVTFIRFYYRNVLDRFSPAEKPIVEKARPVKKVPAKKKRQAGKKRQPKKKQKKR